MRSAYILSIGWLMGSLMSFTGVSITTATGAPMSWLWQLVCTLFGWSNPIIATAGIVDSNFNSSSGAVLSGLGIFETSPWTISIVFQLLLSGVLLYSAIRALSRPFAEQYWMEPKKLLEVSPADLPDADRSTPAATTGTHTSFGRSQRKEWWLIPFFSTLSFLNPVLQRETRSKFRMRQPPVWVLIFEVCLALFVAYFYLRTLWGALFLPREREVIWWILNFVGLTVVALTAAVSGANAFTRERELKTWESLRMSLLSPREIVFAKLGAVMIGFAVFTLPAWLLLLPCIRQMWNNSTSNSDGVSPLQALACLALLAATGVCYTLWGMFWSWRCRKTTAATGWTLGTLFFMLIFAPAFLAAASFDDRGGVSDFIWSYHPFAAMAFALDRQLAIGATTVLFLLVVSGVLGLRLCADLRHE